MKPVNEEVAEASLSERLKRIFIAHLRHVDAKSGSRAERNAEARRDELISELSENEISHSVATVIGLISSLNRLRTGRRAALEPKATKTGRRPRKSDDP